MDLLQEEGLLERKPRRIATFVARVTESGSLARRPGSGCPHRHPGRTSENKLEGSLYWLV